MASITSTGIGSGLDVNSIITQLMAVESRPLVQLQTAESGLRTELSAIGKLQSLTSTMRDAATSLASVSLWKQTVATSANTSAVTVSTDDNAAVGSYSISVQALARTQTVSSSAFESGASVLGEGTLTIELGSWGIDSNFTAKTGNSPLSITIGAGETSLEGIRDKINGSGAGVTATIVNDSSGARLALRSSSTGAENAFRITGSDALSALSYDAANADTPMTRNQTAIDAAATINGIAVTSASNKLEGVADGLTVNLLQATAAGADVDVNVAADTGAVKTAVTTFVTAFNALAAYIKDQTKYDAETKVAGGLQGDRTTLGLQSQLRNVINQASSASGTYTRLSDVGITMQTDGSLKIDDDALASAIDNFSELRKVLATDADTTAGSGFMDRFRDLGNAALNTDGSLETRTTSINSIIARNEDSQESMQKRLDQTEARLRAQYQALDASMAKLNGLSSYMTTQLAALAKTSSY